MSKRTLGLFALVLFALVLLAPALSADEADMSDA